MGRGSGNRKEWQQKNKEDKAAAEAEAAAAEAEEDEDELLLQDEERPSLLTRSHRLLQRLLLSTGWELFMCSSIVLYCVGMGSADIDVEWKKLQWSSIVDTFAFLYSFVVGMLEALLRMLAFGVGLRKKKDDGRAARLPQLTEAQARFVDDTFNLLDTKGLGTLNFREFRAALRELGRDKGLYLFENETKKLFDEVESNHGIEVAELRYLFRRALQTIPLPQPYFQSRWNAADFFTLFVQFVALCASANGSEYSRDGSNRTFAQELMTVARMLRLLTLIRVLWVVDLFRDWISVMPRSWVSMRDFVLVSLFVVTIYGEMGLYLFGLEGRMYGKCIVSTDNPLALAAAARHAHPGIEWHGGNASRPPPPLNTTVGELVQPLRVCSKRSSIIETSYECEPGYSVCGCKKTDRPEHWAQSWRGRVATDEEIASFRASEAGCLRFKSGYIGNETKARGLEQGEDEALPNFGFAGFSNFGVGALTVFTVMTESNYSELLAYMSNANDVVTAWLFVVSLVVLARFVLVGLPIAIISNTWMDIARQRRRREAKAEQDQEDDALLDHLKHLRGLREADHGTGAESGQGGDKARQRLVRQAILRRLGAKEATELRTEIVGVFNMFDTDGSGEIGLAELLSAFRRFGVEMTLREAEALVAEADEDGNGIVDVDEFVLMVEKMLADAKGFVALHKTNSSNGAAAETGYSAGFKRQGSGGSTFERLQSLRSQVSGSAPEPQHGGLERRRPEGEEKSLIGESMVPVCCGLFKIGKHHFEARSRPFFGLRRLAAIAVSWPGVIDECGNLVPSEIITTARLRNIALVWGPQETLGWTAFSIGKGAILLSSSSSDQAARAAEIEAIQENGASDGHVVFPAGAQLPGGKDVSAGLMRDDVTTFLDRFAPVPQKFTGVGSVHWVKGRMESMGSLSDAFVSLCIVANTLGMACEHFEGTIDMDCDDGIRCPNNIVIMSEEWMVLLNMSNYIFGVVFTIEAGLKLCAMGWWRYMGERTNQVDFFLVVVSDADMAMSFFAASFFSISFLRIVRLLRVLRLVNRFRRIRMLIIKVGASLSSVLTVLTIFFCCLGIWGLAGMQLFMCPVRPRLHNNACYPRAFPAAVLNMSSTETAVASTSTYAAYSAQYISYGQQAQAMAGLEAGQLCDTYSSACSHHADCPLYRNCAFGLKRNFNTFFRASATMMVAVQDSSWVQLLYQGMRSYPTPGAAVVFFTVVYVSCMYGLFMLFLAILLENFDTTDEEKEDIQKAALRIRVLKVLKGQQTRQLEAAYLRRDKERWSRSIIETIERRAQEAATLRKALEDSKAKRDRLGRFRQDGKEAAAVEAEADSKIGVGTQRQKDGKKTIRRLSSWTERASAASGAKTATAAATSKPGDAEELALSDSDSEDERRRGEEETVTDLFQEAADVENASDQDNKTHVRKHDIPIFCGLLHPPQPSARHPTAPMNFRYVTRSVLNNGWWNLLLLSTIMVSCLMLALESPVEELSIVHPRNMFKIDLVLFGVFAAEFIIKIVDHGIYWEHPQAYFRSGWNRLDFFILVCTLMDFMVVWIGISNSTTRALGSVRVLRVLRPLRLINKIPSLQLLLQALSASWEDVLNVLLLWAFTFLLFAILGVAIFAGGLHACSDNGAGTRVTHSSVPCKTLVEPPEQWYSSAWPPPTLDAEPFMCDPTSGRRLAPPIFARPECSGYTLTSSVPSSVGAGSEWQVRRLVFDGDGTEIMMPRVWDTPPSHFDNFAAAMQAQVELISLENWSEIAFASVDIAGIGLQPRHNAKPYNFFFFFLFLTLTVFFILQLLVAVFIDAIRLQSGFGIYTDLQRNWLSFEAKIMNLDPLAPLKPPRLAFRRRIWAFCQSELFNGISMSLIVLNTLVMATESYDADHAYESFVESTNIAFTAIFSLEIILRLVAYGTQFFYEYWNWFDLMIVLASLVELALAASVGIKVLRALRISRIFRTIRIIRRLPRLHTIIKALMGAFSSMMSAVLLVVIVSFIFTTLGVQFFGGLKQGHLIDGYRNFDNSWTCMTLLFQVATGSGYRLAIRDASVVAPSCTTCSNCHLNQEGELVDFSDCGNWQGASAFLGIYLFMVRYILLNLLVAVLVDKFFDFDAQMKFVLQDKHLETYQSAWQSLDVHGDTTLPISQLRILVELLHRLKNPLGSCMFADEYKFRMARVELISLCPHYGTIQGSELEFNHTLRTLALHVTGPHALPLDLRLRREEALGVFAQIAVTSRLTLVYNEKRLAQTLEQDKQSSLAKIVRSQHTADAGASGGHHGQNLTFAVFNGRSKIVLDMHREELLHIDDSTPPEILFQMPFTAIVGVKDSPGAALVLNFDDDVSLPVEIDELDRLQLVAALQSFEDINHQAKLDAESNVFVNRKDMQSETLRFRVLGATAMMEVERSIDILRMKRKRGEVE